MLVSGFYARLQHKQIHYECDSSETSVHYFHITRHRISKDSIFIFTAK